MSGTKAVVVVIRGSVQGVGYRWSAKRAALGLGVDGSIRNRADGTVVGVFEGPADAVEALVEWCRRGPDGARVSEVSVQPTPATGRAGFFTG